MSNDPASHGRPADYISALADAGASPDNLNDAQWIVDRVDVCLEKAKALALIDIGRSLRDIRDELHDMRLYGLTVKGK